MTKRMSRAEVLSNAERVMSEAQRILAAARDTRPDALAEATHSMTYLDARLVSGVLANLLVEAERDHNIGIVFDEVKDG